MTTRPLTTSWWSWRPASSTRQFWPRSCLRAARLATKNQAKNIDGSNTRLRNIVGCFMTLTFLTLARDVWKIKGQIPSRTWKNHQNQLSVPSPAVNISWKFNPNPFITFGGCCWQRQATLAKVTNVHAYILLVLCHSISVARGLPDCTYIPSLARLHAKSMHDLSPAPNNSEHAPSLSGGGGGRDVLPSRIPRGRFNTA